MTPDESKRLTDLRDKTEAALRTWERILEDAQQFRGEREKDNARTQVIWLRGYIFALNDAIRILKQ